MKKKGGCFRIILAFVLALVATILFRACTLKAHAETIQLTVQQTLALYGTSFTAVCRYNNTNSTENLNFTYVGNTFDWIKHHESGLMIPFSDPLYNYTSGANSWNAWSHFSNALIYAAPWTVSNVDFPSSSNTTDVNFYLNQSLPLTNLSRFRQYVFWSGYVNTGNSMGNPQNSFVQYMTTFTGTKKFTALNNNAWQAYNRLYTYGVWPTYNLNDYADDTYFEDWQGYMYGVYTDMNIGSSDSRFDITSCEYYLNGVDTVDGARVIAPAGTHSKWIFVLICCPQLDATDFIGPTMPTTTAATTMTTQLTGYTGETISGTYGTGIGLDDIATDIAEIIRNQRFQIEQNNIMIQNGRRTNDNLSIIIEQLNRIYTNMLANGEIAPELVPAAALDTIPPDIAGQIQTALRGTWPTMPVSAFGAAPAVFGEFWSLCTTDGFEIFFYLGCISLACSVAAWILFKGRG